MYYQRNPKSKYELMKKIGKGSYGNVYRAWIKKSNKIVAVKVIDISKRRKSDILQVLNEIRILGSNLSPYVVEYYESFVNSSETQMWIVMEYMAGGDLANKIKHA